MFMRRRDSQQGIRTGMTLGFVIKYDDSMVTKISAKENISAILIRYLEAMYVKAGRYPSDFHTVLEMFVHTREANGSGYSGSCLLP